MADKTIFVTVGTTEFNALIKRFGENDIINILKKKGFTKIVLQIGKGAAPAEESREIKFEWFRFKDSLTQDMSDAYLVVSHAGAGSCLEALEAGKPLLVVVNDSLMNNHQSELAEALQTRCHAVACSVPTLHDVLHDFDETKLHSFHQGNQGIFVDFLNRVMEVE